MEIGLRWIHDVEFGSTESAMGALSVLSTAVDFVVSTAIRRKIAIL